MPYCKVFVTVPLRLATMCEELPHVLILAFLQHAIAHAYIVFVCYDTGERTGTMLNHVVVAACSSSVGVITKLYPLGYDGRTLAKQLLRMDISFTSVAKRTDMKMGLVFLFTRTP